MSKGMAWICCVGSLLCCAAASWANELRAGANTLYISAVTPAGDRLEINALVLSDGDTVLAFCACDTRGLDETLLHAVERRLSTAGSHILPGHLMLSATHTHTGGFTGIMRGALQQMAFGTYAATNVDSAAESISRCLRAAESALQPATIAVGETHTPEYALNRSDAAACTDTTLSALYLQGRDGSPLAMLVNYAAHPTILYNTGYTLGRDFPGGIAARIRQACGVPIPVLFINGAVGDVSPNPPPGATPAIRASVMGQRIGDIALATVQMVTPKTEVALRARCRTLIMPPSALDPLSPTIAVLQDFWIDQSLFLSLPGEVTTPIGVALRGKAHSIGALHVFLCGLADSYNGYYPDTTEYFRAEYESLMDFYGPEMTGWFLKNLFPDYAMTPLECWQSDPLLRAHLPTFRQAYACGQAHRAAIRAHWDRTRQHLHSLIDTMKRCHAIPTAAKSYQRYLNRDQVKTMATGYFSYLARQQLQTLTDEQRVELMGLADGAQLPVDTLMTEQYLCHAHNIPSIARRLLGLFGIRGSDLLARYSDEIRGKTRVPAKASTAK